MYEYNGHVDNNNKYNNNSSKIDKKFLDEFIHSVEFEMDMGS
jgi:hypothetical protein